MEPTPAPLAVDPFANGVPVAAQPLVLMTMLVGLVNGFRMARTMRRSPAACVGSVTVIVVLVLVAHVPTLFRPMLMG